LAVGVLAFLGCLRLLLATAGPAVVAAVVAQDDPRRNSIASILAHGTMSVVGAAGTMEIVLAALAFRGQRWPLVAALGLEALEATKALVWSDTVSPAGLLMRVAILFVIGRAVVEPALPTAFSNGYTRS
jgi:hypothetical protein